YIPAVIDGDVAHQFHVAGFRINLDNTNMRTEGISEIRGLEESSGFETRLHLRGQSLGYVGCGNCLTECHRFFRRLFGEYLPVGENHALRIRTYDMCGDAGELFF